MVELVAVEPADHAALLAFELENRAFFEACINARAPAYYSEEGVRQAIEIALTDVAGDRGYQFLIKEGGDIVGRINLRDVDRARGSAVLGYRIAAAQVRKGYAGAAVRGLLDIAFGRLGLKRIEAGARISNLASVQVLLNNGFVQCGLTPGGVVLNGVAHDRLHFERSQGDCISRR
ncbi:MAG: GNAT family N-acetyltransferase [Pseudomonadota bacterium]|nr:GNAT family N-acetyltransferase [Pseudomonadota bacterium]